MVPTRNHPAEFPEPDLSPQKPSAPSRRRVSAWAHTPTNLTLLWLAISLPLVIWDTGYVLLRPLSMPGGSLHSPLWTPYELYGRVDLVYGFKAWEAKNGFTAGQASLNVIETLMYLFYAWTVYKYGEDEGVSGKGKGSRGVLAWMGERKAVQGSMGGMGLLVAFSAAVMTLSKTVLYWLCEYWSGFDNIGHNSLRDLVVLWIIPNGAWLVLPTYMIYVMGGEILEGLALASEAGVKSE